MQPQQKLLKLFEDVSRVVVSNPNTLKSVLSENSAPECVIQVHNDALDLNAHQRAHIACVAAGQRNPILLGGRNTSGVIRSWVGPIATAAFAHKPRIVENLTSRPGVDQAVQVSVDVF